MFDKDLKDGETGEHIVWNILQKSKKVRSIIDVRQDKAFQAQDIDFLIENYERQFTPIEVKTDFKAHETGNIVYELSTSGHLGCFEKTKATYVYYYIPANKIIYMIDVVALRTYIHRIRPEEKKMGDNATGFLISIKDLLDKNIIKFTYKEVN